MTLYNMSMQSTTRIKTWVVGVMAGVVMMSCSGELDRGSFVAWVRDYSNGLHVQKEQGEYVFDLQFQPLDYVLLQRNAEMTQAGYQQALQEIAGLQYYILTVSLKDKNVDFMDYGVQNEREQQQRLYYFSYLFQNDIRLEEGAERLPCVLFHFERSGDLKNSRTFVLAFEDHQQAFTEAKLVIDAAAFGSLPVRIKISKDNIPGLKL